VVSGKKAQLIEAAAVAFSREGFDRVSVKSLAEACQISEPAVYKHFRSKDAIYEAVLDSIDQRMERTDLFVRLKKESKIETILHGLADHVISFFTANEDIYRLLLFASLSDHPKAGQVFSVIRGAYVVFLKKQLDRLRKEGKIRPVNHEITARCFIGMVFDCAMSNTLFKRSQGRSFKPAETIANNVPIYARGIGA
jgi:AcrR family transcriptional regulator